MSSDDATTENDLAGVPRVRGLAHDLPRGADHEEARDLYRSGDQHWSGSVLSIADAAKRAAEYRQNSLRVVFTNGCFDLLHRGHVYYLREARALGDVLMVGLNSDASVARLKGPSRPVMKIGDRAAVLTALRTVDYVIVFDDPTAVDLVAAIRPDVYVKGGDYRSEYPPEARIVGQYGGEFHIASLVAGVSTTRVIASIKAADLSLPCRSFFPEESKMSNTPLVVAHKGASAYLPGNTLAAFDLALRQGADCIELDVQLTGDGNIVVYDRWYVEDGDLRRPVVQLSLNDIRRLWSQSRNQDAQHDPSDLLTLPEVLSHVKPSNMELVIELKNSRLLQPPSLAQRVIDDLTDFAMVSRSYLLSYDHELIAAIRSSDVRRGILYVGRLVNITETLRATRANFIETRNDFLDAGFVSRLHQMDVQICGSSTDDIGEIARLVGLGADMITTDAPDLARRIIQETVEAQSGQK